ncbi:MAG: diaminohydroxyphosphoribosylaminopyrimidine deaminase [Chitinophagaceae bacterium]|nr:diaminohydroxyphosphoribosylaminopyrimidine deaminase [Chitinophagaceae bacterium]
MYRCLELAKLGAGNVAPNPMVGAVLVYHEKIIGEGYHQKFGEPHAEVNCINSIKEDHKHLIDKSTLYVSLEPCSHFAKTPPCTDLIIKNKIPKVVIGCKDIYKEVDGKGIKKLHEAGIEVITGVLENECKELNKRFFIFHQKQRPYIILKWAESANGKIGGDTERVLISNEYTNRLVHKWRSEEAAILIGTKTALNDDPSLTTRLWNGNNPIRLVTDMNLRLPSHLKIFNKEVKTIIFNKLKHKEDGNLIFYQIEEENFLQPILKALYQLSIQSVIVEGGAKLLQSFIDAGLWDEARIIRNEELIIENGVSAPQLKNAIPQKQEIYFNDTISFFLPFS